MELLGGLDKYSVFAGIHRLQLESSGVPKEFWPALYKKLENQILDAGESFSIFKIDYEGDREPEDPIYTVLVTKKGGIQCNDPYQIYLIDHAWTYKSDMVVSNLRQIPELLDRMCNIMGISVDDCEEEKIENVCKQMWKFNQTYSQGFGNAENRTPVWYIMDEFGSAIEHSDTPNFRTVPFYCFQDQNTYTLLFPIKDVEENEKVTRDYLEGPLGRDENLRKALMIPWKYSSFLDVDYSQSEPSQDYFSQITDEFVPEKQVPFEHNENDVLKVYSDYDVINTYLTHPSFEIVKETTNADIYWLLTHFKDYKNLYEELPQRFINQFPFENVLTVKNLFSVVCKRKATEGSTSFADNPAWFPTTYDLHTDLVKFVSYYQHRSQKGLNNLWICKPWNLARGLDTIITDNLNCILRLPSTGPKVAQKYLDNPLLFKRDDVGLVKFDVRYVLLLKSVQPLCVYAYRNFFLRFANKPFELKSFWDKEKHYTVMNYNEDTPLHKMLCEDFIPKFNEQNPGHKWSNVEKKIFEAFKELFEAATSKPPSCGIGHNVQSRAVYAIDLMLSKEQDSNGLEVIQPKLLEVNWMPDCKRACEYYPTFFNDVFLLLFKNTYDKTKFELL